MDIGQLCNFIHWNIIAWGITNIMHSFF